MLESQRQLAALGLFRRVRITELPRTGSLTRDVLDRSRRSRRRRPSITAAASKSAASPASAEDGSGAIDQARHRPARLLRDQPPQPVGQESIGDAVRPRHAAPRGRRSERSGARRHRRLRVQRLSRPVHLPRTSRLRHHRRRAGHRLHRAGPPIELQLQSPRRHDGLRAAPRRLYRHRTLHLRLHQAVRRADRRRRSAADRSPVPAGEAVESSSAASCATRATTSSIRSAARWSASTARWRRGSWDSEVGFVKTFAQGFVYRRLPGRTRRDRGRRAARRWRSGFAQDVARCRSRSPRRGGRVRAARSSAVRGVSDGDQGSAGERALLRRRRHHGPRLRARSARHAKRRSIRRDSRRAATAWRSSISRRARRTGRTCSSCGSSTPATCSSYASDIRLDEMRLSSGVGVPVSIADRAAARRLGLEARARG